MIDQKHCVSLNICRVCWGDSPLQKSVTKKDNSLWRLAAVALSQINRVSRFPWSRSYCLLASLQDRHALGHVKSTWRRNCPTSKLDFYFFMPLVAWRATEEMRHSGPVEAALRVPVGIVLSLIPVSTVGGSTYCHTHHGAVWYAHTTGVTSNCPCDLPVGAGEVRTRDLRITSRTL